MKTHSVASRCKQCKGGLWFERCVFWMPKSRQYVLPLELTSGGSHFRRMAKRPKTPLALDIAHDDYLRGAELEKDDTAAARAAYEACLKGDCTHLNARINLGRLLDLEGRYREAESIYRDAHHPDAVLFFNLAVLLADVGRFDEAIGSYREALIHDPGMEDAHFNLALLYERDGSTQAAFRHLLAYRRLSQLSSKSGL